MAFAKACETLVAVPLKDRVLIPAALRTSRLRLPLVLVLNKLLSTAVELTLAIVPLKVAPFAIKAKALTALDELTSTTRSTMVVPVAKVRPLPITTEACATVRLPLACKVVKPALAKALAELLVAIVCKSDPVTLRMPLTNCALP